MPYNYYIGLDLGEKQDYSAIAVLEEPLWIEEARWTFGDVSLEHGWRSPADLEPWMADQILQANGRRGRPADPPLWVRHLERLPLDTRYFEVVARVKELMNTPPLRGKRIALLVDRTGVGQGAVDELLRERLRPIAVFAHGGDKTTQDNDGFRTPKKDLIHTAQMLLESGRLKVAPGLAEAPTLKKELANYKIKQDPKTAHESFAAWRQGDHDDLVFAVAMAGWFRQWWNKNLDFQYARKRNRGEGAAVT